MYVATELNVVVPTITSPLPGAVRSPQSTAAIGNTKRLNGMFPLTINAHKLYNYPFIEPQLTCLHEAKSIYTRSGMHRAYQLFPPLYAVHTYPDVS